MRKERESDNSKVSGWVVDGRGGGGITIACGGELVVWGIGTLGICGFGTNCTSDGWLEEIARVGLRWIGVRARLANVIDIKVVSGNASISRSSAERPLNVIITGIVCSLAGGVGSRGFARVESRDALAVVGVGVGGVLRSSDDGLVGIVIGEVDVGLVLERRVKPSVVDAEGNQLDVLAFHGTTRYGGVLLLKIVGEFWTVVSSV